MDLHSYLRILKNFNIRLRQISSGDNLVTILVFFFAFDY